MMSLLTCIKKLLAPPVFADQEQTRSAALLNAMLLTMLGVTVLLTLAYLLFQPDDLVESLLTGVLVALPPVGLLVLLRYGYVRLVATLLSCVLLLIITLNNLGQGGIRNLATAGYFVVVIIASLLLGGRAAFSFFLMSLAAALYVFYAETQGAVPVTARDVRVTDWVVPSVLLGMGTLLLRFGANSFTLALERAHNDECALAESNHELQVIRESLETRTDELSQANQELQREIDERLQAESTLRHLNYNLAMLNQLGQELAAKLDQQQVVEQLLPTVAKAVRAEGASLWLWQNFPTSASGVADEGLVCHAYFHTDQSQISMLDLRLRPGQGIAGWVIQTGQSVVVPIARDDPRFFPGIDDLTGFDTVSLLAAPLWVRGKVIGVLEVVNKLNGSTLERRITTFDVTDCVLVETLAISAAVALDNAQLIGAQRQYASELEARNEELDAFAHTVAHDLKDPLARIVGFAELLHDTYQTLPQDQVLHCLNTISRNGRKMSNITDALLLLAGVRQMSASELLFLDMGHIVAEALERLAHVIQDHQAEIILPAKEEWPPTLGYAPWVEEVWLNYISNAIKYGGKRPRVELGAVAQADSTVRLWVRDNGLGLNAEQQARLFKPFTRLDQIRVKGYGLGLSIVRRIVEKLGGQVGVDSQTGKGSTFWFTLPNATYLAANAPATQAVRAVGYNE